MKSFRRLGRFLRPYRTAALLAPLLMALEVAMDLCQPRLLQLIVDQGITTGDVALIGRTGALMLLIAAVGAVGGIGCTVAATFASLGYGTDLRAAVFRQVQALSLADLNRFETGSLITRLTNDVDQVQNAVGMFLRILVRAPLLMLGSLLMAIHTCPQLWPLLAVLLPTVVALFGFTVVRAQPLFKVVQERLDRLNAVVQENLAGVRVVQAFVRSEHEVGRFETASGSLQAAGVEAASLLAGLRPLLMLLVNAGLVGALWFGGHLVARNVLPVGAILAFLNYLTDMLFSLLWVGMLLMQVTRAEASSSRLLELLETVPAVQDPASPQPLPAGREVQLTGVSFTHPGGEAPVLSDLTCTLAPGSTVAVVGSTGSGKSTLLYLLPRLYDVSAGAVRVAGLDVRTVAQRDLRGLVGLGLQEAVLFSGSIRDNLRYGNPAASDADLQAAARLAQAEEFIVALPDGYETMLGQRGVNLSGGQKQRLAIARALVAQPQILLLDDCTSAVDALTEAAILDGLAAWPDHPTLLLVAQRVNTMRRADTILVLDDGRLVAAGTHDELLAGSAIYQEIVRSQVAVGEELA
ncbi:MAG: ABC transporter ATP-binding protein [Fimbriimonadaceae bacterium]|nr:ABC transporter ATP-binding protein [Fimbriimonadaceae bacterium]